MSDSNRADDRMSQVVSLCKRRGFIFASSEIYGGLKSTYDYGPLGTELKRNLCQEWWRSMVQARDDVVGFDASIIMHPDVWKASGHLAGFSDPLVDCRTCKHRFRSDKAPAAPVGSAVRFTEGGKKSGRSCTGEVGPQGILCPQCGSPDLSEERQFNLMFRTHQGSVDPLGAIVAHVEAHPEQAGKPLRAALEAILGNDAVYLRPETAQAMFVQFANVQQSMSLKVPFGIAQIGKSFRNEITVEHFIFRSCEFEQMEMEFFVEPGTQAKWLDYWRDKRLAWWQSYANHPENFRTRPHAADELAHYADACFDIEYLYPWGYGELEGVASRTDYDLRQHAAATGANLSTFDPQKVNPQTGKPGWRYVPYVIEPSAGATRGLLVYLLDAYCVETVTDGKGQASERVVLKLHPRLAPIKAAVLPLVKKDGLPEIAHRVVDALRQGGLSVQYDEQHAVGKRYRRHDEIGTPFCLTIDGQTRDDGTLTLRHRDSMQQERIAADAALEVILGHLRA
jgi:glycyl-tRNA synthetase